jgi:aminoglycoside/choline kinase family phosphotransferase
MQKQDIRKKAIQSWLQNELKLSIDSLAPASSDASFRRYFRVGCNNQTYVVMDAPPDKENIKPFIEVAGLFASAGINIPKIYQVNLELGFLLLEDFGSQCYLDLLNQENVDVFYEQALNSLFKLQSRIDFNHCQLPVYDFELLNKELDIFTGWFLGKKLNITTTYEQHVIIEKTKQLLIKSALEQPVTCVHRDYHSRNLMVTLTNNPGIIDFQDAVIGPITYDLVSLLKDCYIEWPEQMIDHWLHQYFRHLKDEKDIDYSFDTFKYWFDLMGIQRHLKAIGIFSRLHLRDNKPNYLQDIPRTLNYVLNTSTKYPELSAFNEFFQNTIMPAWRLTT